MFNVEFQSQISTVGIYVLLNLIIMTVTYVIPDSIREFIRKKQVNKVNPGDYVLTKSGFYGIAEEVMGDAVVVEFGKDKHCRIPVAKSEIKRVSPPAEDTSVEMTGENPNI